MNKKIFMLSFLTLSFLFSASYVLADEDETETIINTQEVNAQTDNIIPEETTSNIKPIESTPTEQKRTLREIYNKKVQDFRSSFNPNNRIINENEKENRLLERGTTSNEILEKNKTINEEALKARQEKIAEMRGKLEETRKERIKEQTDRILENFERILQKIETVTKKTRERIITIEERDIDLTEAKNLIEDVPVKIESARQSILDVKNAFEDTLNSETPISSYGEARQFVSLAKTKIKEAHESLIITINAIKSSIKIIRDEQQNNTEPENTN